MRKAISITLTDDNLLWLKAQAGATDKRSVSEVVDSLVTEARAQGRHADTMRRSVVGTIDLPPDEDLAHADSYVRALFDASTNRPMLVKERFEPAGPKKGKRG